MNLSVERIKRKRGTKGGVARLMAVSAVSGLLLAVFLLALGCATNEKVVTVDYKDPATGKITKTETTKTSITDRTAQARSQTEYARLMSQHKMFWLRAGIERKVEKIFETDPATGDILYGKDGKPLIKGERVIERPMTITMSGVAEFGVSPPMPRWQKVPEPWVEFLSKANGWLNLLMFGWLFGPQNYDHGGNISVANYGDRSNTNIRGAQAISQPYASGGGASQGAGNSASHSSSSASYTDSSQNNKSLIGDIFNSGDK